MDMYESMRNGGRKIQKIIWPDSSDSEDDDANNSRKPPVLDIRIKKKPAVFIKAVVALLLHRIEGFWTCNDGGEYELDPESGEVMRFSDTLSFTAEAQGVFNASREEGLAGLDPLDEINYTVQYGIFKKSHAVWR